MSGMLRFKDEAELRKVLGDRITGVRSVRGQASEESGVDPQKPRKEARSAIEEEMALQIKTSDLPPPVRQYRYLPDRRYRADFAWPDKRLSLEVDGAVHRIKGSFAAGFERDFLLKRAGWMVIHVGRAQVKNGDALKWITEMLGL